MKRVALSIVALIASASAGLADPVEGVWKTQPDDGAYAHIKMSKCGAEICGTIARTFNADGEYQSENLGKLLVFDMVPDGDGSYSGKVWRPANDKVYIGKINLNGNSLSLKGCVAGGLICKKQSWSRIN